MDRCRSTLGANNNNKLTGGKIWQKNTISGFPGDVWRVPVHDKHANLWINKVLGVIKTKNEAQAIVDALVETAQNNYDAQSDVYKARHRRPTDIPLEE